MTPAKPHTAPHAEISPQRGATHPNGPPLPHELDQQTTSTAPEPDAHIEQAAQDLAQGQVDTDLRATPGLDANRRGRMVKGGERGAGDGKGKAG